MNELEINEANLLYSQGKAEELYEFIKKFLEEDDPYAKYFYSTFSLANWNESEDEQESRRMRLLMESAEHGVPEALYQLACCYLSGDGVPINWEKSEVFAKKSAEKGYEPAGKLYSQIVSRKE